MNSTIYLAELDMTGSYTPLIWAFIISFFIAACLAGLWTWWRAPVRIQARLRRQSWSLAELNDHFHIRASDWFWSFLIALGIVIVLSISFYLLLNKEAYQGLPLWVMLTTSMLTSQTLFGDYHPLPFGILAAVLVGFTFGRILGLTFGKKYGAKRVLITSRLRDPVKF